MVVGDVLNIGPVAYDYSLLFDRGETAMSENIKIAFESWQAKMGEDPVSGDWLVVDQARIDNFADATLDHQFIHVDVEGATSTPFGGTIAHGFLILSLLPFLTESIPSDVSLSGALMKVNYGLNKLRFTSPVLAGSRVRATEKTLDVVLNASAIDVTSLITVEIEGQDKPALVAEWIARTVFA